MNMQLKKVMSQTWRKGAAIGLTFGIGLVGAGCGNGTNLNKIWGGSDEASDTMLREAKVAYDKKDYSRAESLAISAYDRNGQNEEAAVLLGYIYLSQGGIDPFALARGLIAASKTSTTAATSGTTLADSSTSSDGAGSLLTSLSTILNLTDDDMANLHKEVYTGSDSAASSLFSKYPIYVPVEVTDDLREKIPTLRYMNKAVKIVCRFIDDTVKGTTDSRDTDPNCTRSDGPHELTAKAHFLWAFSHLGETLVYQTTLLYSSTPGETSNFQAAAKELDTSSTTLSDFTKNVSDMKGAVDAVFDTTTQTGEGSMLSATLSDLDAVNRAFGAIAGLPATLTKSISDAMTKINAVGEKLGGSGVQGNAKALKGQMTEKFAKVISQKMDAALNDSSKFNTAGVEYEDLPEDKKKQVKDMCDAYSGLVEGLPEEKQAKPSKCP